MTYLEEYNSKLVNDLYDEKEDLIKRSIEFEYIQKRLDEKEKRLSEIELENARRWGEINSLKKDNEHLRQQMESMTQFIKKLATSKLMKNHSDENGAGEELVEAITVFADRLKRDPKAFDELATPEFLTRNSGIREGMNMTVPVEHERNLESSPVHKIIKKRYKAAKSRKRPKYVKIEKPPSPLNQDQIKLLHDPKSFEKYAQDLDIATLEKLYQGRKKTTK